MLETLFGLLSFCTGTSGSEPQSFLMDGTLSNSKKSHTNHVDSFVERGFQNVCIYSEHWPTCTCEVNLSTNAVGRGANKCLNPVNVVCVWSQRQKWVPTDLQKQIHSHKASDTMRKRCYVLVHSKQVDFRSKQKPKLASLLHIAQLFL